MTFYVSRNADGTIHVQNAVGGMFGQHHVHDAEGFETWKQGSGIIGPVNPDDIEELAGTKDCDCGLAVGEVRQH